MGRPVILLIQHSLGSVRPLLLYTFEWMNGIDIIRQHGYDYYYYGQEAPSLWDSSINHPSSTRRLVSIWDQHLLNVDPLVSIEGHNIYICWMTFSFKIKKLNCSKPRILWWVHKGRSIWFIQQCIFIQQRLPVHRVRACYALLQLQIMISRISLRVSYTHIYYLCPPPMCTPYGVFTVTSHSTSVSAKR